MKNTKNEQSLVVLSISDVHVGHNNTKSSFIIENLNKYFSNNQRLVDVDIVFIAGDFFDRLLSYDNDEDIRPIEIWIASFLRKCHRFNVLVRILEGTPRHDRKQSRAFLKIADILAKSDKAVDIGYFSTLSIEYIQDKDLNILYVPDEWKHDTHDTYVEAKALMQSKGLERVDFAIMHGLFTYQVPEITKKHIKHDEQLYLEMVKYLIFIGHDHHTSNFERIFVQGSFDRLSHGEEHPKGFLRAVVEPNGEFETQFIENESAQTYYTIECRHEDPLEALNHIQQKIKKLRSGSFVRVVAPKLSSIALSQSLLERKWPELKWSIKHDKPKQTEFEVIEQMNTFVPIIINENTITGLVEKQLSDQNVDPSVKNQCLELLKSFL